MSSREEEIVRDLKLPLKTFRIFALEEAIKFGASSAILQTLKEIRSEENDSECLILIDHAITAVSERLSDPLQVKKNPDCKNAVDFLTAWKSHDLSGKMNLLSGFAGRIPQAFRGLGPELLLCEKNPVIVSRIIRIFSGSWPLQQLFLLSDLLRSDEISIKLSVLRSLVYLNPASLIDFLPELLEEKDPQIKAFAIRALAKIDAEETAKHLEAMLFSPDSACKIAGLVNCTILPFDLVRPMLLRMIAAESNRELILRAAWILKMNPDGQIPYRLYEIISNSPPAKAELLKDVLKDCYRLIEKSGIVEDLAGYQKELQQWIKRKKYLKIMQQLIEGINSGRLNKDNLGNYATHFQDEDFKATLEQALEWPMPQLTRETLRLFMARSVPASGEKTKKSEMFDLDLILSEPGRACRLLAEIKDSDRLVEHEEVLVKAFSDSRTKAEVKIAILDCFGRCNSNRLVAEAVAHLHSAASEEAAALVGYLGLVDAEAVFPFIGRFLNSPAQELKTAALKILIDYDFNQAVSALSLMLNSRDLQQKKTALACVSLFDFELIRDKLTDFLYQNSDVDLARSCLCSFAANPDPENVYCLFKLEKSQRAELAAEARRIRLILTEEMAGKFSNVSLSDEALLKRWQQEKDRKKNLPAYAYKKPEALLAERTFVTAMIEELKVSFGDGFSFKRALIVLFFPLFLLSLYFFLPGREPSISIRNTGAMLLQDQNFEGEVKEIRGKMVIFESFDKNRFLLDPVNDGFWLPGQNHRIRVRLFVYRRLGERNFAARVKEMEVVPTTDL